MKTVQYRRRKYAAEIAGVVDAFIHSGERARVLYVGENFAVSRGFIVQNELRRPFEVCAGFRIYGDDVSGFDKQRHGDSKTGFYGDDFCGAGRGIAP